MMNAMKKKSSHSKIKNTGILFELLTRQITSDLLNNVPNSPALSIMREAFKKGSQMQRELVLYQALQNEKHQSEIRANYLLEATLTARKRLSEQQLKREKFNLIREIKSHYDLESFFKARVSNYKLLASIYQLFESADLEETASPIEISRSKIVVLEHIYNSKTPAKTSQTDQLLEEYSKQSADMKALTYKLIVDKFNAKYKSLTAGQQRILKEYINSVTNTINLTEFINSENIKIKQYLAEASKKEKDPVLKIKLTEVLRTIPSTIKSNHVADSHIIKLLLQHELIEELSK